jgi:hypothetical protein
LYDRALLTYWALRSKIVPHGSPSQIAEFPMLPDEQVHPKFEELLVALWRSGSVLVPRGGKRFSDGTRADLRVVKPAVRS